MKILDIPQSGKLGLAVSYDGRNGQVRRQWVIPSNPRTTNQTPVRTQWGVLASGWRSLDQSVRDEWDAAAHLQQTRVRLGQSGPLTGLQYYMKLNQVNFLTIGVAVPAPPAMPAFTAQAVQNLAITAVSHLAVLNLTCPLDPGSNTFLRASAPLSAGIVAKPKMAMIGACPTPTAGASNITSLYTARWGAPPGGAKIFVEAFQVITGFEQTPAVFSAIVPSLA